ncbi:MAG: hypothetical protein K9I68_10095 [Bacteroidales bacterium]|nr:hypothetical protein [Bacteroidales bacterium]MCF8338940.1 hypothetical protein [Bacteroidales bacterium]
MASDKNNKANEPLSEYGQPTSFQDVWKMFQETEKMFDKSHREFQEFWEQSKETNRKIDRLAKMYGGASENSREMAEEFFKRGLEARDSIFGFKYEQVDRLERKRKNLQGEYDIVLHNGEYAIVIEVKFKLHPDDVDDFIDRKLPKFKPLFKEYAHKKVIGAVAAMSVPKESYEKAKKYGLLILSQSGENIAVMNPADFEWKEF